MTEETPTTRDTQIRKSVIMSLIASVIFMVCIQPVLRLIWAAVLFIGSRFLQGYIDSIYIGAALGHRNSVDVLLLVFIYGALLCVALVCTHVFTRRILQPERRPRKPGKYRLVFLWLLIILLLVIAIFGVVGPFADLQLNTSFQQRLKVLAPKITDLQMKELEAAWASMRTRADFLVIQLGMEQTATQHNIVLPKALWK